MFGTLVLGKTLFIICFGLLDFILIGFSRSHRSNLADLEVCITVFGIIILLDYKSLNLRYISNIN